MSLTFIGPCIRNIFSKYNLPNATFHNLFISVRGSTCFRRFFRPSSGAQNCTYSVRHFSDRCCYLLLAIQASGKWQYWSGKYLTLYVQFWALEDGRKTHLKHVERLTVIHKLRNIASCRLYFEKTASVGGGHRRMKLQSHTRENDLSLSLLRNCKQL